MSHDDGQLVQIQHRVQHSRKHKDFPILQQGKLIRQKEAKFLSNDKFFHRIL